MLISRASYNKNHTKVKLKKSVYKRNNLCLKTLQKKSIICARSPQPAHTICALAASKWICLRPDATRGCYYYVCDAFRRLQAAACWCIMQLRWARRFPYTQWERKKRWASVQHKKLYNASRRVRIYDCCIVESPRPRNNPFIYQRRVSSILYYIALRIYKYHSRAQSGENTHFSFVRNEANWTLKTFQLNPLKLV